MNARVALVVAALVVLLASSLLWPADAPPLSASSFGRSGTGHAGLFDLLSELELVAGRSLEATQRLTGTQTIWWIDPLGVCDGRIAMRGDVDVLDPDSVAWAGGEWISLGGTAVVFLQAAEPGGLLATEQEELVLCDAIAGVPLPSRSRFSAQPSGADRPTAEALASPAPLASPERGLVVSGRVVSGQSGSGQSGSGRSGSGRSGSGRSGSGQGGSGQSGSGQSGSDESGSGDAGSDDVSKEPRRLALPTVFAFDEALDWEVAAEIGAADGRSAAFVLAREVGAGRLVVVADSGFTHNRWLDAEDAAVLAVDLVRTFDVPRFDEREHGFLPETSAILYLAHSPALPVFAGMAFLSLLYLWRAAALPSRSAIDFDPAAPTLDTFVASMTLLYAGTRDHAAVLARYRELVAGRIRRHFGLPPEVNREALVDRIRSSGQASPELLAGLAGKVDALRVESEAELTFAVRALDRLAREITR